MNIYAALVAAAIAFGAAWKTQDWRYGDRINSIEATYAKAAKEAEKAARAKEQETATKLAKALDEANQRAQKNAALAHELDGDVIRVREQLAAARSGLPQASCETARNYAAALSDVYGSCIQEYRSLAEKADGAISDLKTLEQAWPE